MTIRLKSHLILGTVFLSGLLLLGTAGRSVLGRALLDIEAEGSRRDGERVLGELADLEARIGSTASDWGSWDDTYQFVTGRDSTYPARNVDVPTLLNLQLNLLALFDNEGRLAYATFLPRDGKALQSVAPALGRRLQKVALHRLAAGGWPAGGLLPNGDLPLLVSAHPVLRSNRKGPAAGMIVVGRFLDRPELDRLGAKMGLSLSLRPVGPALAPDFRRAVEALSGEVRYYSHPLDAREMGIYAPVSDLAGRPAAVLRATAPRGLHVFMAALVRRGALWAVGLGVPLCGLAFLLLDRGVLRRLAGLSDWVETVTDRPELPAPAAAAARDEIGTLARAVLTLVRRSAESLQASEESRDALSRSEERYRELLAACPDSVIVYDARGNVTYVNEAFEATYGWKPEEVIGRRLDFFVPEDELAASRQSWERALLGERVFCESARLTKDGRRLVVQITAAVVRDRDGAHRASLAIHRDLTLQRAAEAERREVERKVETSHKLESLGVLAGGIAHDFNNVLTPIMGFTEQALDELEPESGVREKLERVLTAAGRARDLVSQILIFSRASEDVLSPVRVQPLVNEALYFLRASLPSTVEIVSDLRCERDLVNTNPSYIHQILMNLGTNAVHAMEKGGGTMRVGLETLERPQGGGSNDGEGWLRMTVSDTGCGIDPAMVDRIFEPFFTTKGVGEGTGMGLSVVHGIVKKLGGMISVRSNKGQGTTFEIHLPLVGASAEAGRAAPRGEMVGGTESILLVDDERDIAECWGQALEQLGYRTRAVRSGPDALALLDAHPGGFDLLVTDQTMPQMTGVALARRVLARSPGFPIVLCTGYSNAVDAETAAAEGIREFLMKPVSVPDLAAALRRALDGRDC